MASFCPNSSNNRIGVDRNSLLLAGGGLLVCFLLGMLVGHLVTPTSQTSSPIKIETGLPLVAEEKRGSSALVEDSRHEYTLVKADKWKAEKNFVDHILQNINPDNLRSNLRYLSSEPHLAASSRDDELATHIKNRLQEAGFDSVQMVPYNLYLTKPDPNNPNKITLNRTGETIFTSRHKEEPIHADDADPNFVHAFNAFTPAGTVSTEPGVGVVYVNYGRLGDFRKLKELGVNVSGHVALVRYGKIYRGNKVAHAQLFGAKGVIIFSDPEDVAPEGTNPEDVYDNTFWLPGTGMQRGNTYLGIGDPLTPAWPSTEHAYRIPVEEANLHKIPAQPIGYADAKEILERLDGDEAPEDWQGGFTHFRYKLGPFFNTENKDVSLTLSTHNSGKIERSYNVIGVIKGSIEPDRYVLIGNHRDAWGYGASDPSSGTAQLLETARVFGTLLKRGWRPRRSLVFCSWGAEEFGLIGSTEWVEENVEKLQSRAVAYVNTDTCTSGPMLAIKASPLMKDMFLEITKMVPGVQNPSLTLFDEWKKFSQDLNPTANENPTIGALGSGSDFASFSMYAGVPAASIWFRRDETKYNISIYPYYHTGYETFHMVSTFVDPEFKITQGCGRVAALALKRLADSTVLPYSIRRYPEAMAANLKKSKHRDTLIKIYDKYGELETSVQNFAKATADFEMKLKDADSMSDLQVRALNDQMMKLEQIFLIPEGLPGRPAVRNAVFANSQFDKYASDGFPGLSDLMHGFESLGEKERKEREKLIKRHVSDLTIMTDRATSFLKQSYLI